MSASVRKWLFMLWPVLPIYSSWYSSHFRKHRYFRTLMCWLLVVYSWVTSTWGLPSAVLLLVHIAYISWNTSTLGHSYPDYFLCMVWPTFLNNKDFRTPISCLFLVHKAHVSKSQGLQDSHFLFAFCAYGSHSRTTSAYGSSQFTPCACRSHPWTISTWCLK